MEKKTTTIEDDMPAIKNADFLACHVSFSGVYNIVYIRSVGKKNWSLFPRLMGI